jgi:hypothetical protein
MRSARDRCAECVCRGVRSLRRASFGSDGNVGVKLDLEIGESKGTRFLQAVNVNKDGASRRASLLGRRAYCPGADAVSNVAGPSAAVWLSGGQTAAHATLTTNNDGGVARCKGQNPDPRCPLAGRNGSCGNTDSRRSSNADTSAGHACGNANGHGAASSAGPNGPAERLLFLPLPPRAGLPRLAERLGWRQIPI